MSEGSNCPSCAAPLTPGSEACDQCGAPLHRCRHCDWLILESDAFCGHCGRATADSLGGAAPPVQAAYSPWDHIVERLRETVAGEYEIIREIGRGGFAAVYLAHETALNRRVAIKVMSPDLMATPGMYERFRREGETEARMTHPNIITVHAVRMMGGLNLLVMRFVDGLALDAILARRPRLPHPIVSAIVYQVGSALAYAHRRSVVHRDIKPGNILISTEGNAIVTDFGIAKVTETQTSTQTGATLGTVPYMSPEQCYAKAVGTQSDQYSLGVVAFEMLTGQPPFLGSQFEVMVAHTSQEPPSIRSLRPDCPPELAAAVHRMLAKRAEDRFPSLAEMLTAIGGVPLAEHDPLRETIARMAGGDFALVDAAPIGSPKVGTIRFATPRTPAEPIPVPPPPAAVPTAAAVLIGGTPPEAEPGQRVQLTAEVRDQARAAVPLPVTWRSLTPEVAAVSPAGMVLLHRAGRAVIEAECQGVAATVSITVEEPRPPVAAVLVDPAQIDLEAGEDCPLTATAVDADGASLDGIAFEWSAEPPEVAGVHPRTGRLEARAAGTAVVTVRAEEATARIEVLVTPARIVGLTIAGPERVGVDRRVRFEARGTTATGRSIPVTARWSSDKPGVAAVDEHGTVRGTGVGTATVRAAYEDLEASARLVVSVPWVRTPGGRRTIGGAVAAVALAGIVWGVLQREPGADPGSKVLVVDPGAGGAPVAGAAPDSGRPPPAEGALVAGGEVTPPPLPPPPAPEPAAASGPSASGPVLASVRVTSPELALAPGGTGSVRYQLIDDGGRPFTDAALRPAWSSTDPAVAVVDQRTGTVTARAPGRATIRVEINGRRGQAVVVVAAPRPASAQIVGAPDSLVPTRAARLGFEARSAAGSVMPATEAVRWSSSDPAVASVTADGTVTAVGPGRVVITGEADGVRATAAIRVPAPVVAVAPPPAPQPIPPPPPPAAATVSAGDLRPAADQLVALLRANDLGRITALYDATDRYRDKFLGFVKDRYSPVRGGDITIGTPSLAGTRATAPVSIPLDWLGDFGGKTSKVAEFSATFERSGSSWQLRSIRLSRAFP
ncbi:MAG: protein kinase [Gemmatimonadales bacterium]